MYILLTQTLCSLTLHFPNYRLLTGSRTAFLIPHPPSSPVSHLVPEPAGVTRRDGQGRAGTEPLFGRTGPVLRAAGGQWQEASETGSADGGRGRESAPRLFCLSPPSPLSVPPAHGGSGRAHSLGGSEDPAEQPRPPPTAGPRPRRARTVQGAAGDAPGPARRPVQPSLGFPADPPPAP